MAKSKLKNDQIFKFFQIKRNSHIDSPFNEDPKNINFSQALISKEGRPENLGKMGNNRDIYCYANRGSKFRKSISISSFLRSEAL